MILPDHEIRKLAQKGMITPFWEKQRGEGILSYGLSSYGYDARVDRQFKVFKPKIGVVVDPKNIDESCLIDVDTDQCIIPPNSFALARTMERFRVPRNIMVICLGKSTYARCGIIVNVTPLEPEWGGTVTLEFSNTTSLPVKIYAGEGACQFLFFEGKSAPEVSYADRNGKYQDQDEITLPRILSKKDSEISEE